MNIYTASYQFASPVFFEESTSSQAGIIFNNDKNAENKNLELENKSKKLKADAEKSAKLMQKIWGDNFQSDSLH